MGHWESLGYVERSVGHSNRYGWCGLSVCVGGGVEMEWGGVVYGWCEGEGVWCGVVWVGVRVMWCGGGVVYGWSGVGWCEGGVVWGGVSAWDPLSKHY